MSADNRLLYYFWDKTQRWHIWDASASYDYFEPPEHSEKFDTKEEVFAYIDKYYKEGGYTEYGAEELSKNEIIRGLKEELSSERIKLEKLKKRLKTSKSRASDWRERVQDLTS